MTGALANTIVPVLTAIGSGGASVTIAKKVAA